jgi:hypothetical protein
MKFNEQASKADIQYRMPAIATIPFQFFNAHAKTQYAKTIDVMNP